MDYILGVMGRKMTRRVTHFTVYVTRLMVVPIPEVDDSPTRVSASLKAEEGGSCRLKTLERKE